MKAITAISFAAVTMLSACGGGSDSDSSGIDPTPVIGQQSAEGLWRGYTGGGLPVTTLVTSNGGFYQFFGIAEPAGQMFGALAVDTNNQAAFSSSKGIINGTFEQNRTITKTYLRTKAAFDFTVDDGFAKPTRTHTQDYDISYDTPLSLADLQGTYSGATVGQQSNFTIDDKGNITGEADRSYTTGTCPITGTINPNATKGWAIVTIAGCNDSVDGVGKAVVLGRGVGQQILIGTQDGYGEVLYGVKQ